MQSETEVALMDPALTLDQAKMRLRSNLEELSKLTILSEGLLQLAHLEEGGLRMQPIALGTVIQRAIARSASFAETKNILITSSVSDGMEVFGDEVSLTEAIIILLDNAIKYSPEKTEIIIAVTQSPKHVALSIKDQGIGIKATELPHIFDRFYRADTARSKQRVNGYGLGLAIAKNIITLHDGVISVHSKPGKGSTFTISLPKA
jgi:signal transduction histidine kinase